MKLPCESFIAPNQTVKTLNTNTRGMTGTGMIRPIGGLTIAANFANSHTTENQNDRITPKWIVDYEHGDRWTSEEQSYWEQNVSYRATGNRQHEMEVEFSMGINVKEVNKTDLPPTSFIIQNQTILWIRNKSLKSKGYGMIVLTSSYIPDIMTDTELYIVENQKVELSGNSLANVPITDNTVAKYDVPLSLSVGVAPATKKPGWLQRISSKLGGKSATEVVESSDFQISKLSLHDFKARGWDATTERWRMPAYPSWGRTLNQVTKDSTAHVQNLTADPTMDNLPESKGRQYDPSPTILERAEKEEVQIETVMNKSDGLDVQVQIESGPSRLN
ncbi:hypothetical protein C8R44DRAFT_823320 [Mycena epipterygia]|nr:hypothetical protein C8R44DRAFT_823320 [Mycena epipterygia]